MLAPHPYTVVERYNSTAQCFHWITVLLVVFAYIISVGGPGTKVYSPASDFRRELHELLGLSVFVLTLIRMGWRAIFPPPDGPEMPIWMKLGARLSHWTIYILLVLVPLTAILGAGFEGHPLTVLAVGNIQTWLPRSPQLGLVLANIHGWLGDALIWLAGFHAAAALYHHYWRRDTVLRSMLP
jgi:cytochrome b561